MNELNGFSVISEEEMMMVDAGGKILQWCIGIGAGIGCVAGIVTCIVCPPAGVAAWVVIGEATIAGAGTGTTVGAMIESAA